MSGPPFAYHRPASQAEAADLLARLEDAAVLGGGTMLVPALTQGRVRPANVVDLGRAGLAGIRASDGKIVIGATTTYRDLERSSLLRASVPLLPAVATRITGGAQIRNVGTIGGSACYANPNSDMPACLVSLDATFRVLGRDHAREVAASAFFRGAFKSEIQPGELLVEIVVSPFGPRDSFGYEKLIFCESSWPILTAACILRRDEGGRVVSGILAIGGAAAQPLRLRVLPDDLRDVEARVLDALVEPWSEILAPGEYRRRVAPVVARRAVQAALMSRAVA